MSTNNFYTDLSVITPEEVAEYAASHGHIPFALYQEILKWISISTVDFILTRYVDEDRLQKEFFLVYRAEAPFQGKPFVPGGRVEWGESLEVACLRQVGRELGVSNVWPAFKGHVNVINPASDTRPMWNSTWHVFEVEVERDVEIKLNTEGTKAEWFTSIDSSWSDPVRRALELAGFL
ncbi:NUDIX domain-containing protein [Candidatus Parcubacteria bacterium]|nr:NUDIX domain-containing protein [Candidatus Parcubacteria bacterium]